MLNCRVMKLKKAAVLKALKRVKPQRVKTHMVILGTKIYPVKQVYASVTGEDPKDFDTKDARKALKKAGFQTWKKT